MAVKATARATFYKREKGSYTFLRYSNDGGQTFTAASQAAIDAAKGSLPLEGRNLLDVKSIVKDFNVTSINISNATTNTFNILVGTDYNAFRIMHILPFVTDTTKWVSRKYVLSGYIKADVDTTVDFEFGDIPQNEAAINVTSTSTYFAVTFNRTRYLGYPWYGFIDFNLPSTPTANITFSFDKLKLEVGEVATTYSPCNLINIDNAENNSWVGRNLVFNSGFYFGDTNWNYAKISNNGGYNNHPKATIIDPTPDDTYRAFLAQGLTNRDVPFNLPNLTISYWYKATSDNDSAIGSFIRFNRTTYSTDILYDYNNLIRDNQWHYISITNSNYISFADVETISLEFASFKGTLELSQIKLEYGYTATTWTPAPEDCTFGTTEGEYLGTLVWDKPYPSNNPADYTWGKVKGETGKDAVTVRLVPDKVVVDTDTGGHVTAAQLANAVTTVEAYKGGAACAFTIGTPSASSGIGYTKTTTQVTVASIADDPSTGYAYGSGYIDIPVTVDGVVYKVRLTVETNIHKVVATLKQTATEITASVSSLTQTVDSNKTTTDARIAVAEGKINTNVTEVSGLKTRMTSVEQTASGLISTVTANKAAADANINSLQEQIDGQSEAIENNATAISTISQKADSISLMVSETVLKGNLLAGTMFRREEEVPWNNPAYKGIISTAVQYGETNSVYLESTSETDIWKGVRWAKIPVTAEKKYNMSFWYKTPDAASNGNFAIEVQAFKADGTHAAVFRPLVNWQLPIPANYKWKLYSADMTADSDVSSVNVLIYLVTKGKMYIARPMLIEGSYVGWQRSEQDYDYIGGNLLDETKTLAQRGSLTHVEGTVTGNAFGWCSAIYAQGASPYTNMLQWLIPYDLNADYTLSFLAKGTGKMETHIYSGTGTADVALFTERLGDYNTDVWGTAGYSLTPEWKRHTVRWRTKGARTDASATVNIRVLTGSEVTFAQPKLEKGCTATEWTDGDRDMVSTKALLATGIDIEEGTINLKAENCNFIGADGLPYIKVKKDDKGMPHFIFLGTDGVTEMYDLGYTGLKSLITNAHDGIFNNQVPLFSIDNVLNNPKTDKYVEDASYVMSVTVSDIIAAYKYSASYSNQSGTIIFGDDEIYDSVYYKSNSSANAENLLWLSDTSNIIPDGWYAKWETTYRRVKKDQYYTDINIISCYQISNGRIVAYGDMYVKSSNGLHYFTDENGNRLSPTNYTYIKDYIITNAALPIYP